MEKVSVFSARTNHFSPLLSSLLFLFIVPPSAAFLCLVPSLVHSPPNRLSHTNQTVFRFEISLILAPANVSRGQGVNFHFFSPFKSPAGRNASRSQRFEDSVERVRGERRGEDVSTFSREEGISKIRENDSLNKIYFLQSVYRRRKRRHAETRSVLSVGDKV